MHATASSLHATPRAMDRGTGMPVAAGIGLRAQHHLDVLADAPRVGWFEAHAENYFADGGARIACLERIREDYPLSLHGVGLSLGGTDPLDHEHLAKLGRAVRRFQPMLISEHLSWSSAGGRHVNDLLPLPYTEEALANVSARIRIVQDRLGCPILVENVSSYLEFECSRIAEWDFLIAVAERSGCGILLDLNNIHVSAHNHGFDAARYVGAIPRDLVGELHLAGHTRVAVGGRELLIDTHSAPVAAPVWDLYRLALERFGPKPTLIEWDAELPPLAALIAEADRANEILRSPRAGAP
jgi:uncharacterized protein (UPF0276 family)